MAVLAYFGQGALEKQQSGPPRSSYNMANIGLFGTAWLTINSQLATHYVVQSFALWA